MFVFFTRSKKPKQWIPVEYNVSRKTFMGDKNENCWKLRELSHQSANGPTASVKKVENLSPGSDRVTYSQMNVQNSCGRTISKENSFYF